MKRVILVCALNLASVSVFASDEIASTMPRPALTAPKATKARLLDITVAGSQLVLVGEEGAILRSVDGKNWLQAPSPTNVMLTRVHFTDANIGWVLGYDASILRTIDGGKTWSLQHHDVKGHALYDLLFLDAQHGVAVGAYGTVLETSDGGNTWTTQDTALSRLGLHLNVVLKLSDGSLFVAGERGLMARSKDAGNNWLTLNSPYAGSWFGALPLENMGMLLYGMRGNVFSSANLNNCATADINKWDPDARQSVNNLAQINVLGWKKKDSPTHESLFGALALKNKALLFVGVNGTALKLDADGNRLILVKTPAVETLTKAVAFNGRMVAVGSHGIQDLGVLP